MLLTASLFSQTFLNWHQMGEALPQLLSTGLPNTIELAGLGFVGGIALGLVVAALSMSEHLPIRCLGRIYVNVWRGLPTVLSIVLIGAGLPLAGVSVFGRDTYAYAIAALAIVNAAFLAEIFRSGIQSIGKAQGDAGRALGLSRSRTMILIVLPQGIRRVLPALVNQFVICLKESALVYLLGLGAGQYDLFSIGQNSSAVSGNYSVLLLSGVIYLCITIPLSYAVNAWDRSQRDATKPAWARFSRPWMTQPVEDDRLLAGGGR